MPEPQLPSIVLPRDEIMRQMAKIAVETATEGLAKMAIKMADEMRSGGLLLTDGPSALELFAKGVRANNKRHYGRATGPLA